MTKFTKEQLIAAARVKVRNLSENIALIDGVESIHLEQTAALIEIALAALTEQPVGFYRASRHGDGYYLANNMEQTPGTIPLYLLPLLEGLK